MKKSIKKFIKKLTVLGCGIVACLTLVNTSAHAAVAVTNVLAGTNGVSILSNGIPAQIFQIQIVNTTANNLFVQIFDSSTGTNTYVITNGYTNSTISTVTYTNIYTNILGSIQTNIYTNIMNTVNTNVVSPYTNAYATLWAGYVISNSTSTFTPPINSYAWQGVFATNTDFTVTGGLTYNLTYLPVR